MLSVERLHSLLPELSSGQLAAHGIFSSVYPRVNHFSVTKLFSKPQARFPTPLHFGRNVGTLVLQTEERTQRLLHQRVLLGRRTYSRRVQSPTKETVDVISGPSSGEMAGHRTPIQKVSSIILAPPLPPPLKRFSQMAPADQAFLLLGFIAFMTSGALFALLATAIPTLNAMRRAALSLERLADTAREELPGTMAAVRLSGMEISDLTLELSDLSQEISEGVRSSARAVQAAEVGIRRIGSFTASQTLSMLQEHASLPVEAVRPVVATAAENTWQAVTQAQRAVLSLATIPALSRWIQKKNIEEQKKIEEDMGGPDGTVSEDESGEVVAITEV